MQEVSEVNYLFGFFFQLIQIFVKDAGHLESDVRLRDFEISISAILSRGSIAVGYRKYYNSILTLPCDNVVIRLGSI